MKFVLLIFIAQDTFLANHFLHHALVALRKGWRVVVATNITSQEVIIELQRYGIEVVDTQVQRKTIGPWSEMSSVFRLVKIINEVKPNVIHNYGTKYIIYATAAAKISKVRPVIINNLTGLGIVFSIKKTSYFALRILILVFYWFFLNPRGSYVIGENVEDVKMFERIKALRKNDVILVPGAGVNISKFSPGSLDEKEQIVTVVMCSRLLKTKGVLVFLEAAEILKKRDVSIQMWLVGGIDKGNPDSLSLGELERWKAKGSVKIFGHVSDVSPILRRAHIFALPSEYREGLPKALLEGAASGLAIVTTDTIGCRETVTGHNGILLKQSSPQCLADALEELSKSSILEEMGKRSRELACLKFNEIIVDKAIDNLYSKIQEQNQNL